MKKNILAIILALCMVIAMLPAPVFAAHNDTAGHNLPFVQMPAALKADLNPIDTAEPNAKEYTLTLGASGYGDTGATAFSAAKGEVIYILADPSEGYLAYFDTHGDDLDLVYIGYNMYQLTMPGHNVTIDIYYEAAEGDFQAINVICKNDAKHSIRRSQYSAKQYESVFLYIKPDGFELRDIRVTCGGEALDLYYLGELEGEEVFEFFMPDGDVEITIDTISTRVRGMYLFVNEREYLVGQAGYNGIEGQISFSVTKAKPNEQVILNVVANEGYELTNLEVTGTSPWDYTLMSIPCTYLGDHNYAFSMPESVATIYVTLVSIINPVSVTVETGLGGTASLDMTEAKAGDIVTLTCAPEEGYRIARITGAELTDNGDNTYTFTMPDAPVELKVLFLRENNPFLDVNETHFFYDPVLWAVEEGITNGLTPETFGPYELCNRAQVVTFLWRAAGEPEPETTENPFTDVPAGSFYEKPVLWALENGITTGTTPTTFDPNGTCMRAHVVTFLHRAKGCPEPETTVNPFEDVDESDFYYKAVLWALENGVTTGADATHFNPLGLCQRAQVVTFLYRAKDIPTVHALHWVINGFQDTPSDYGTVELSHAKAAAGETVTATVVPAEGYQLDWAKCEFDTPVTQVSDTEFTFVMPDHEEIFHVNFSEIPVEPTDPEPTEPTEPEPTDPTEPTEPEEPVKTYELDLRDNGNGRVAYVDGKTTAAPGESIFFYALPNEGYYLDHVGVFNPDGVIDVSTIVIEELGDGLYELIMIPHDLIITCHFYPIT